VLPWGSMSTDYAGFGHYLMEHRRLKGLSLHDVARSTKIPTTLIDALEQGRAERLPGRVFLVHHIKSYASVVGLPPEDCVSRFHELPGAPRAEMFDPGVLEAARRQRATAVLWGGVGVGALLVGVLAYLALLEWMLKFAHR
jgi:cytoskeletal protein RodZ